MNIRPIWIFAICLTLAGIRPEPVVSSMAGVPRDVPARCWLLEDLADERLDGHSLLQAALLAGGLEERVSLSESEAVIDRFCAAHQELARRSMDHNERAIALFQSMHDDLLTGKYDENCWQLDKTIQGGPYNCVTSTILYLCLCRRFQIEVVAVARPGHVYGRLQGDSPCAVQTTCPQWFSLEPRERQCSSSSAARGSFGAERELSDVRLLAKVYYNRAAALLRAKRFRAAVQQLQIAHRLDPADASARKNLVAALNNWSLDLCDAGRFDAATKRIKDGLAIMPDDAALLANDLHIHQRWAVRLCQQRKYAAALQLLRRCHRRRPDVVLFDQGQRSVYRDWANWLLKQGRHGESLHLLSKARRRFPDSPALANCELETRKHLSSTP